LTQVNTADFRHGEHIVVINALINGAGKPI
jgi:hypothetical protein